MPPQIDLSSFLNRQLNIDVDAPILHTNDIDDDDVDHTLAHISSHGIIDPNHGKGKIEEIEWDNDMDEMTREKAVADANRGRLRTCCFLLLTMGQNSPPASAPNLRN